MFTYLPNKTHDQQSKYDGGRFELRDMGGLVILALFHVAFLNLTLQGL